MRIISFLFLSIFLVCLLSVNVESAAQKSVVTVVEGKVMCFDLPEGMPVGALKTGVFIERIQRDGSLG